MTRKKGVGIEIDWLTNSIINAMKKLQPLPIEIDLVVEPGGRLTEKEHQEISEFIKKLKLNKKKHRKAA